MIQVRARPARTWQRHVALIEMFVAAVAPLVAERAGPEVVRWVRRVLIAIRPSLESMVFEIRSNTMPDGVLKVRASHDLTVLTVQQIIQTAGVDPGPVPRSVLDALSSIPAEVSLHAGFVPSDPRAKRIEQETVRLLESEAGAYWRTLTNPETLARRITKLRRDGVSNTALAQRLSDEYRANYAAAERLVRTAYNTATNMAQFDALAALGYTHKRWLTARDARVRRAGPRSKFDHVRMDGVIVPLNEPFTTFAGSRMQYPGDPSAPSGDRVNCRCTLIGVTLDSTGQPQRAKNRLNVSLSERRSTKIPAGNLVRSVFTVPDGVEFDEVRRAFEIVDRVHGITRVPPLRVEVDNTLEGAAAVQTHKLNRVSKPVSIVVNPRAQYSATDVLHELGHTIHLAAVQPTGRYLVRVPALRTWWDAVQKSKAHKALMKKLRTNLTRQERQFLLYLLRPKEVFARSYAQYIAVRSGDLEARLELGDFVDLPFRRVRYTEQWSTEDFEPIMKALDDLLENLGWTQ